MVRQLTPLVLLLVLPLCSCVSKWTVIKQADPNPFVGQTAFKLLPLEYVDLQVDGKSDAQHAADMDQEGAASWKADKAAIKEIFRATVMDFAGRDSIELGTAGKYVVKPLVNTIETGYYRIPAWNAVSRIHLRLQLTDPGGAVLDEILVLPQIGFDIFNAATGGRLRTAANHMGIWSAQYLAKRVRSK